MRKHFKESCQHLFRNLLNFRVQSPARSLRCGSVVFFAGALFLTRGEKQCIGDKTFHFETGFPRCNKVQKLLGNPPTFCKIWSEYLIAKTAMIQRITSFPKLLKVKQIVRERPKWQLTGIIQLCRRPGRWIDNTPRCSTWREKCRLCLGTAAWRKFN